MIRLLIVEDENIERNYLVNAIRSMDCGIDEVFEASDGLSGLRLFEQHHPEIVIADIVMPLMDGLEMLCRIKETDPQTVCFILSSYNSFDYARKALRMGIDDFLTKPCTRQDLQEALRKAIGMVSERTTLQSINAQFETRFHSFENHAVQELLQAARRKRSTEAIRENLQLLQIDENSQAITLRFSAHPDTDLAQLGTSLAALGCRVLFNPEAGQDSLPDFVLFAPEFTSTLLEDIRSLLHGFQVQLSKPEPAVRLDLLFDETALPAYDNGPALIGQAAALFIEQAALPIEDPLDMACASLLQQSFSQMPPGEAFVRFAAKVQESALSQYSIKLYLDFISDLSLVQFDPENHTRFVLREIRQQLQESLKRRRLSQKNSALEKTYRYIEESFRKPISLQSISQEMNISPYYLSRILNRETGESFTDLVNRFRIEEAKKLIRQGKSIKEASWNAGFSYQNYFSKVFKKLVDLSPREYRALFR